MFNNNLDTDNHIFKLFISDGIDECLYNLLSNIYILYLNINDSDNYKDIKNKYEQLLSSKIKYLNERKKINNDVISFII